MTSEPIPTPAIPTLILGTNKVIYSSHMMGAAPAVNDRTIPHATGRSFPTSVDTTIVDVGANTLQPPRGLSNKGVVHNGWAVPVYFDIFLAYNSV